MPSACTRTPIDFSLQVGRCTLLAAIANACTLLDAQAACGPLAVGAYSLSQTCTPLAGVDAALNTQPGTTLTTTVGSSLLSRDTNANAAISLSGTAVNSSPATSANAVFSNVLGAGGSGNAAITVSGGTNTVNVGGTGLDALAITNANTGLSTFSVTAGTTLNILNTVVGNEHDGIDLNGSGGGSLNVTHAGSGSITTLGGNGIWAKAVGDGNVNVSVGSGVSIVTNNDDALSAGPPIGDDTLPTAGVGNGDLTVLGGQNTNRAYGIIISADAGNTLVNYAGNITASGFGAGGIRVDSVSGNVRVDYSGNRIETFNSNANGIYASASSTTATVDVNASGTIITHSDAGSGDGSGIASFGLQALSRGGDVSVTFSGQRIDVNGSGAAIIAGNAFNAGTGLGTLTVNNSGELKARGDQQRGIRTLSTTGQQTIVNSGPIQTLGATNSQGILAEASDAANLSVNNSGAITTRGTGSSGIDARTQGGTASVSNSAVIQGGWSDSAGVQLGGSMQSLNNTGSIGALSDAAVRADATGPGSAFTLTNVGQMTGSVTATSAVSTLNNSGIWTLRNFSDSTGSGTRDTWGLAVSNLGSATGNSIDNTGLIRLAAQPSSGIVSFNTTGAYLPRGQAANMPTLGARLRPSCSASAASPTAAPLTCRASAAR